MGTPLQTVLTPKRFKCFLPAYQPGNETALLDYKNGKGGISVTCCTKENSRKGHRLGKKGSLSVRL